MTFFNSVELPTTQPLPTTALPRINAQWRTSASSSIINGPFKKALLAMFALFATQIFSPLCSNRSGSKDGPRLRIKSLIPFKASHGYSTPSKSPAAIVSFRSYICFTLHCSIIKSPFYKAAMRL